MIAKVTNRRTQGRTLQVRRRRMKTLSPTPRPAEPGHIPPLNPAVDGADVGAHDPASCDPAGRDAGGRFTAGNACGKGNPHNRRVAKLKTALLSAVTEDDMRRLGSKLLAQALAGDTAAAKLLLAYTLGKPARGADPDRVDLDELKLVEEYPDGGAIDRALRGKIDPADAAAFVRAALKVIGPAVFGRLARELRGHNG
jgi:hypothetical protein